MKSKIMTKLNSSQCFERDKIILSREWCDYPSKGPVTYKEMQRSDLTHKLVKNCPPQIDELAARVHILINGKGLKMLQTGDTPIV